MMRELEVIESIVTEHQPIDVGDLQVIMEQKYQLPMKPSRLKTKLYELAKLNRLEFVKGDRSEKKQRKKLGKWAAPTYASVDLDAIREELLAGCPPNEFLRKAMGYNIHPVMSWKARKIRQKC